MSALMELARRCDEATGPDRELDALIAAQLRTGTEHAWAMNYPAWEGRTDGRVYLEKGGPSFSALAYTASIDAAMSLVPKGADFTIEPDSAWIRWMGATDVEEVQSVLSGRGGKCTALALCSAALKARAQALIAGGE